MKTADLQTYARHYVEKLPPLDVIELAIKHVIYTLDDLNDEQLRIVFATLPLDRPE